MAQPKIPCIWCRWLPIFVIGLVGGAAVLTYVVSKLPSTSTLETIASPDPTAGWVLFQDSDNGFEFRYPPNWRVDRTDEYLNISDEKNQLLISIEPNVNTAELSESDCDSQAGVNCEIFDSNSLIFEIDWGESEEIPTAFTRQSQTAGVRFSLLAPSAENKAIFLNLLSTFVFNQSLPEPLGEATTAEECRIKGGVWQKWGLAGMIYCQIPAPDAGERCTDGAECSLGNCLSADGRIPGTCQKYTHTFGCFSYVENGQIRGAVCID